MGVVATRPNSQYIKRLLLTKENQTSQVKEFSAFLCMGRCKSLDSLKSFLWYAPQLSGASILCFLILSLLRVHHWGWLQWLMVWWWASSSILSSLRAHHPVSCNVRAWRLQHPLFMDTAGNIFSLTRIVSAVQLCEGRRPTYYDGGLSGMYC